jgi:RecA-family ATPase
MSDLPPPFRAKPNGTVHHLKAREPIEPLRIEPASLLADRAPPPERDWVCEGLGLPAARVTSFIGNGGFGKSTIAHQIALSVALSTPLFGMPVRGGPVLGIFCEDEQTELDRKTYNIARAEGIDLGLLDSAYLSSRDGEDNVLCSFNHDQIALTDFYWRLDATVASIRPRLTIVDTASDVFAGDFMSTPHVRQFIKVALGGLCVRHETAVLLLAHPSASAMASGDGGGFSTAWNNSVRSRWYLRRPKTEDAEETLDRRVLEVRKANYGPSGGLVPLRYEQGRFVLDPNPLDENAKPVRALKRNTRLSLKVMDYFRATAPAGQVVKFSAILETLQKTGDIPLGDYQTVRRPLYRELGSLVEQQLLSACTVPRGCYRMVPEVHQ